ADNIVVTGYSVPGHGGRSESSRNTPDITNTAAARKHRRIGRAGRAVTGRGPRPAGDGCRVGDRRRERPGAGGATDSRGVSNHVHAGGAAPGGGTSGGARTPAVR